MPFKIYPQKKLILDKVKNSIASYSLRRLRQGYFGPCIRIFRDDDGTEKDIGFIGNDLDTRSILAFLNHNLISNPSMDTDSNGDGIVDGFSSWQGTGITPSFQLDATQRINILVSTSTQYAQVESGLISVTPGEKVTLEVTGRVSGNVKFYVAMNLFSAGEYADTYASDSYLYTSDTTIKLESQVIPAGVTQVSFVCAIRPLVSGNTGSGWFKNAKLYCVSNSALISKWYDQSGNSNDLTQNIGSNKPKIVDSSWILEKLNNKPTIRFVSANSTYLNKTDITINQPNMVNIVCNPVNTLSNQTFFDSPDVSNNNMLKISVGTPNKYNLFAGTSVEINGVDSNFNIFSAVFNGENSSFYKNGALLGNNINLGTRVMHGICLGAGASLSEYLDGYISEVIIFNKSVSIGDKQKIELDQSKYFNITLG